MVAAISDPMSSLQFSERSRTGNGGPSSNVMFSLQHDTGKWCTEYTWSAEDGMWGIRCLHNFGKLWTPVELSDELGKSANTSRGRSGIKRVDEEEAMEGGLKGRISAGAEFYLSAKEKSAGGMVSYVYLVSLIADSPAVSAGIRFTTLPDATPPSSHLPPSSSSSYPSSPLSQPPTTITALFNPMLGHISGAYAARVSRDLALCSRFDFNVYSYESEWSLGAEWWTRRSKARPPSEFPVLDPSAPSLPFTVTNAEPPEGEIQGVVKARASTTTV